MAHPRHLHEKIIRTLGGVACVYLLVALAILELAILPSFRALERQQAAQDLGRATEALRLALEHVEDFVGDWSGWDDTYAFVADGNRDYVRSNLESNVFRPDSFDFICLVRADGTQAWRDGRAPDGAPTRVAELPEEPWPLAHPLLAPREASESSAGILLTSHGPLLIASRAVTDSARTAPRNGWIMMGRFLTDERVAALAARTALDLTVRPTTAPLDPHDRAALARLGRGFAQDFAPIDGATLRATALLPALDGNGGLLVRADLPRAVLARGRHASKVALLMSVVAVLVLTGVLMLLLRRIVVEPLGRLTRHAVALGESDDLSARSDIDSDDELGSLARELDTMVARLAEAQTRLVEAARAGGMSEIATSVLHDVGNALQGVGVSADLIGERLTGRNVADLARVATLLDRHSDDLARWLTEDPRGRCVPAFLVELAAAFQRDQSALQSELRTLRAGVEHIGALVSAQQRHAGRRGALELVAVGELLDSAVQLSAAGGQGGAVIERRYEAGVFARAEKHRLLAVLVNLLRNARQALGEAAASGTVRLSVRSTADGLVRVEIEDDGIGIAAEDLGRIFQSGYSTKPGGHGLGLHSGAITVRELGGRLFAESAGPGLGARFVLELPAATQEAATEEAAGQEEAAQEEAAAR